MRRGERDHAHHSVAVQVVVKLLLVGQHHRADIGHHLRPRNALFGVFAELLHVLAPAREHRLRVAVEIRARLFGVAHGIHHVGRCQAVDELRHHFERDVLDVEVEDRLALAPGDALLEGGDLVGRDVAFAILEEELLQLRVGVVRNLARAGRGTVDRGVVHQHDHAVFGHARVDLEERGHHRERLLERLDAVFGESRHHAAAVAADDDRPLGRIAEPLVQLCAVFDVDVVGPFGLLPARGASEQQGGGGEGGQ